MLEVRLLGQFSTRIGGKPVEIPSRPSQSLLAYLLLNQGKTFRRERLAGMFWPEATDTNARHSLRHALWRVRKSLEEDKKDGEKYILADKITATFNHRADYWVDALQLESEQIDSDSPDDLIASLSHYGGELLPGFYEDWVVLERERFRAIFEDRMHNLLDLLITLGRHREALEWAERWIAFGQVPEPAYRALMLAYNALGDVASVAATYRRCSQSLRQELGVKPSPMTRSLYHDLIAGNPTAVRQPVIGERGASAVMAVRTLLHRWEQQGDFYLDLPSLAMVYACRSDLHLEPQETALLIRSALYHGVATAPWLKRASSQEIVEGALRETLADHPPPPIRLRVVEAAREIEDASMDRLLMEVVTEDKVAEVRSAAAVAAAQTGHQGEVLRVLLQDIQRNDDPSAYAAFVAVADEVGIPPDLNGYSGLRVGLSLFQRRWRRDRNLILRQVWQAALGTGVVTAVSGSLTPFYRWLISEEIFREGLTRFPLPGWVLTNILSGLFIGFLQGASSGFALGLADSLWRGKAILKRFLFASISGLYYAFMWIIFSLTGLLYPAVGPELYIPIYILFGLYFGAGLSLVAPILGAATTGSEQIRRIIIALIFVIPGSAALIYLTYLDQFRPLWLNIVMEIVALTVGFGLSFINLQRNHDALEVHPD